MRKIGLLSAMLCMLCMNVAFAQSKTVTGTVKDSKDGTPLEGVTVVAKNAQATTVTDAAGKFELSVPAKTNTLIFSYIGYAGSDVKVGSEPITVQMVKTGSELSEVIVVGYG
ncbi:MAG: carboxypeptidase-like regulatory domain-containing protein, partial [Ferruginibacter sp.]|nr:carboxypeptidase-like regulatory domain-containing protein [Ferruginibacter sp.]